MKRNLGRITTLLTVIAISSQVLAQSMSTTNTSTSTSTPPVSGTYTHHSSACKNIAEACRAANPAQPRNWIWMNCIKPIAAGGSISGVTVNPGDVQACSARMQQFKQNHGWHHHDMMQQQSNPATPVSTPGT